MALDPRSREQACRTRLGKWTQQRPTIAHARPAVDLHQNNHTKFTRPPAGLTPNSIRSKRRSDRSRSESIDFATTAMRLPHSLHCLAEHHLETASETAFAAVESSNSLLQRWYIFTMNPSDRHTAHFGTRVNKHNPTRDRARQ